MQVRDSTDLHVACRDPQLSHFLPCPDIALPGLASPASPYTFPCGEWFRIITRMQSLHRFRNRGSERWSDTPKVTPRHQRATVATGVCCKGFLFFEESSTQLVSYSAGSPRCQRGEGGWASCWPWCRSCLRCSRAWRWQTLLVSWAEKKEAAMACRRRRA